MDLHTQAFYSIVDQRLNGEYPLGKAKNEILDDLHKAYSPLSHVQGKVMHTGLWQFGVKYCYRKWVFLWAFKSL